MDFQISGKCALVTGATQGIGFAIAAELLGEGANVIINGRSQANVDVAVKRLSGVAGGGIVSGIAADLGSAEGVAVLAAQLPKVDILVNNLGIFEPKPFAEIEDGDWIRFFEVNVMSGVRLARHCLPTMKAAKWGRVVFISSESAINTPGEMVHYGMSKSAQLAVSRGLAQDCAGTGVTVNAVLPGPTRSEGVGDFFARLAADGGIPVAEMERCFFAEARPTSIIKRMIEPREVASLVAYVCSNRASATTGAALRVEGGIVPTIS